MIEKGCRAVIINSRYGNNGIIVNVGDKIGYIKGINTLAGAQWTVDQPIKYMKEGRKRPKVRYNVGEKHLRRLPDSGWDKIEELCGWRPNHVSEKQF